MCVSAHVFQELAVNEPIAMTIEDFRRKLEVLIDEARRGGVDLTDISVELEETAKAMMAAGED
jgi:hypothetical protein